MESCCAVACVGACVGACAARRVWGVRSRSCGAEGEARGVGVGAGDAPTEPRRKARRPHGHKRRGSLSAGGALARAHAHAHAHAQAHARDAFPPRRLAARKAAEARGCSSPDFSDHSPPTAGPDTDSSSSSSSGSPASPLSDALPCLSASDLSSVYKSLELLNGYLTMQGFGPYEAAFLKDPRVSEILSHIQHGCPLARRPSKHLPRIDSSLLPKIDWSEMNMPSKTELAILLVERIHAYVNTDIEVLIGRQVYSCHLLVLQCYSSYFDDVNGAAKVHLPEDHVTGRVFHTIYDWMISTGSKGCELLRRENVLEVLAASQFLGIRELEEQCWVFINSDAIFMEETAFLMFMAARRAGNKQVMDLMLPKVRKFFLKLVSTVDFVQLEADTVAALLGSNYIAVHNEMEVFMAAVLWLTHDWGKRRGHAVHVLRQVRFGWLEPWQVVDIRRNYASNPEYIRVTQNPEVRRLMEEGLAFATTREACAGDAARLRDLADALCLAEPAPRHWLAPPDPEPRAPSAAAPASTPAPVDSFRQFVDALPKYREAGALDAMRYEIEGVGSGRDLGPRPARRPRALSPTPTPAPAPAPAPALTPASGSAPPHSEGVSCAAGDASAVT